MQKVKMFDAYTLPSLQGEINEFIENGHIVEQISSSNYVNGYTKHYTCTVLYHDKEEPKMCPTIGDIDARR